jgi:molecular chaperone Hsp33
MQEERRNIWEAGLKMSADYAASALAAGDYARIVAARTTHLVRDAQTRHGCSPTVTAALGRLLTGAGLMSLQLSGRERTILQINCEGPVRGLIAEAATGGRLRGYPLRPRAELPLNERGKFDVAGIVGRGYLHVTRVYDTGQPYTSAVPLVSGEIGEDLAHFFARSEQLPTVVAVGVLANPAGVVAAGGILAHLMPGANPEIVDALEAAARGLPQVTTLVREGATPEDLVRELAGALDPRVTHVQPLSFHCRCDRSRVAKAIVGLGSDQLKQMARADNDTEATCDFCGKRYYFSPAEVAEILAQSSLAAEE